MISHGVIKREFYLEAAYEKVKLARAPQRGCVIHYADLVGARFFEFGPNIEPVLVEALKDENADIRIGAALAMAKFKDQRAVPILLSAVQEPFVFPEAAAGALMQLGRQEGFDFLVKGMRNPHYPDKWVLAMELGNQGDRRAVEPLLAMLSNKSGDEYFRKEAALALGKLGETKAIPAIRNLLKDPDDQVRRAAADALRQLGVNENSARKK
jgi:HEAT repeat protein